MGPHMKEDQEREFSKRGGRLGHQKKKKPEKEECWERRIPKEWNRIGPYGEGDIIIGKVATLGERASKQLSTIWLENQEKGNTERENISWERVTFEKEKH